MHLKKSWVSSLCLFVCVALELVVETHCEYEWSGFVNDLTSDFDYVCPSDLAVVGLASEFRLAICNLVGRKFNSAACIYAGKFSTPA